MKKLLFIAIIAMIGCNDIVTDKFSKYQFGVTIYGGSGMASGYSSIYCDSVNMITAKEAELFVDGRKIKVKADDYITVWSNVNKK